MRQRLKNPWWLGLVAVAVFTVLAMHDFGEHPRIDLEVYRRGGQSVIDGTPIYEQPYGLLPFTYPPLAAILFSVLAWLPAAASTLLVTLASYMALFGLLMLTLRRLEVAPLWAPVAFIVAAKFEPVMATVNFGQINLILAAVILIDLLHPTRRWSGVLLGLAICVKLTPAIFVLAVLAHRDFRMLTRTIVTVLVGTLLPAVLLPESWIQFWFHAVWDPRRVGGLAFTGNQSLTGVTWRALGPGGSVLLTYTVSAAVIGLLVYFLWRRPAPDRLPAAMACAFAGLLVSPVSWTHHWVWIAPFMLWAIVLCWRSRGSHHVFQMMFGGVIVAGWGAFVLWHLIWLNPTGNDQEYGAPVSLKAVGDAYAILGLASLALLVLARPTTSPSVAAQTEPAEPGWPALTPER